MIMISKLDGTIMIRKILGYDYGHNYGEQTSVVQLQ